LLSFRIRRHAPVSTLFPYTTLFRSEEGSCTAIMGPSGSGKSTLMNILGCLDRPTSGELYLRGEAVSGLSDDRLAKVRNRDIGFVDRKSTRLNSSHVKISYAVFCLKK